MDNKPRFYTMIDELENYHLVKDIGMIPYALAKQGLCNSTMISYGRSVDEFTYLDGTMDLVVRPKYFNNSIIDGCLWLIKNAKKIDILNLYHYTPSTFAWVPVYKLFNPKGKVYLKLDIDPYDGRTMSMRPGSFKYFLSKCIFGMCSYISCETESFLEYANEKWPTEVGFTPNGVMKNSINCNGIKEKIILNVARLGTEQKATEILLEAFAMAIDKISEEWKLILVGTAEPGFLDYFKEFQRTDSRLFSRISYLGEIKDRNLLESLYEKASIFTMASRYESFGIVCTEALSKCDYLLTTDIISFREIANNGEFGSFFQIDNIEEYCDKIVELTHAFDSGYKMDLERVNEYMLNKYCYENITADLYKALGYKLEK